MSEDNPASTSVTIPAGTDTGSNGTVSITESSTVGQSQPPGFSLLGYEIEINAPEATVDNPLEITFLLHDSLIPEGVAAEDIEVFRNGERVLPCVDGSGRADPDPCLSVREGQGEDVGMVVLTSSASVWNFGVEAEDRDPGGPEDPKCTIPGTPGNDVLNGTPGRDVICGFGGNDRILGRAGNDTLVGGPGKDVLRGEGGNDRLDARDGVRGNDVANGGPGRDACSADKRDVRRSC